MKAAKRIRVWVQSFTDRDNLVLQWFDPDTGRRRSASAKTDDDAIAEQRRADLEALLNREYARMSPDDEVFKPDLFDCEAHKILTIIRSAPRGEGSVYFIQEYPNGALKVGWSKDVEARVATHQSSNARRLRLLGTVPGSKVTERLIQQTLRRFRHRGEWFRMPPSLLAVIRDCDDSGTESAGASAE